MNRLLPASVLILTLIFIGWQNRRTYVPLSPQNISAISEQPSPTPEPSTTYTGKASWYGESDEECAGCSEHRLTASGEPFNENANTAACADRIPLGTRLRVSYGKRFVEVKCNDRGGFDKKYGRVLDLSKGSFSELTSLEKGIITVTIEEIEQ